MHRGMKKRCGLKMRCNADRLVDLNEYFAVQPGVKIGDKICVAELNEILLISMPNRWSKHTYAQGFDCKYTTFKSDVNMFECMKTEEYIYKGVL